MTAIAEIVGYKPWSAIRGLAIEAGFPDDISALQG